MPLSFYFNFGCSSPPTPIPCLNIGSLLKLMNQTTISENSRLKEYFEEQKWRSMLLQQVEGVLQGTKMEKHVTPQIPELFLVVAGRDSQIENPAFVAWEEQDSLLCTWLLFTIPDPLLSRFVHLRHS